MQTGDLQTPERNKSLFRRRIERGQRGQSLVEFALSLSVLILVFSGAVDLGRMFFTRINIDSMIGEGLHWAAAYPGCLKYGVDRNDRAASNVDHHCWQTNSIQGRMDQENNMLNGAQWVTSDLAFDPQPGCTTRCSVTLDALQSGDTIKLSTTYRITLITPVMRALFGDTMEITVAAKEVVRGGAADIPDTVGGAVTHPTSGGTLVDPITDPKQGGSTMPNLICNQGSATITWTGVAGAAGYRIYNIDTSTTPNTLGSYITSVSSTGYTGNTYNLQQTYIAPVKTDMTSPAAITQIAVKSIVVFGTYVESDPTTYSESQEYFAYNISCNAVHPSDPNNTPAALTPITAICRHDGTGLDFTWDMRTPVDTAVTGYQANRVSPAGVLALSASPSMSRDTRSGTHTFASAADWTANSGYNIQALDSSNAAIGSASNDSNAISCAYTSHVTIDIIDDNSTVSNLYTPGVPMKYTIRMTNTDTSGNAALGLVLTTTVSGFDTGPESLSWQCVTATALNGAHCNGSTSGTATPGTSFTPNVYLPAGGYLEITVSGTAPAALSAGSISATASLAVPTLCGTYCTINGTSTVSAAPDLDNPNLNTNLSITADDGRTTYQAGDSISYVIKVKNTGAYGATGVTVTDSFTGPFTQTGWTCTVSLGGTGAPTTACTAPSYTGSTPLNNTVNIAAGGEITYIVTGTAGTGGATLTNTAAYSHALAVPSSGNASDPSDAYQAAANLKITYVDSSGNATTPTSMGSPTTYTIGQLQTYRVKVANTGADAITANFTNDGAGLGSPSNQWSCSVTTGTATCPTGSNPGPVSGMPSNQSFTINSGGALTFVVTGTVQAAAANPMVNTSTITSPSIINNGASSATASNDLTGSPAADLTLTGTFSGTPVYFPGDTLTYTVDVTNLGSSTSANSKLSLSYNTSQFSTPTYVGCTTSGTATCSSITFNSAAGTGTTGTFSLNMSGHAIYTFTLKILASSGTNTVTANVTGAGITDPSGNNSVSITANSVSGIADLQVSNSSNTTNSNYVPGSSITYTIVAKNNGPKSITGATLTDTYPAALTGVTWTCVNTAGSVPSSDPGGGTCTSASGSGGTTSFNATADLPSGKSVRFTVTGTVASGTTGSLTNVASVTAPSYCNSSCDTPSTNNSVTVTDTNNANIGISSMTSSVGGTTSTMGTYSAGSTITYTVVIKNFGPNNVSNATFNISPNPPTSTTGTGTWSCTPSGIGAGSTTICGANSGSGIPNGVTFSLKGNSSDTITYVFTVTVTAGTTANVAATAVVSVPSGVTDSTSANNTATVTDKSNKITNVVVSSCAQQGNSGKMTYVLTWSAPGAPATISTYNMRLTNGTLLASTSGGQNATTGTFQFTDGSSWTTKTVTITAGSSSTTDFSSTKSDTVTLTKCS